MGKKLKMQIPLKSLEWNETAFFSSIAMAPEDISVHCSKDITENEFPEMEILLNGK